MSLVTYITKKVAEFPSLESFIPKSIICLREGYTKDSLFKDIFAGLTVGIISLPLVMAFAIGSGVNPDKGLFTAIVAGFLISLFGGTRFVISGPTGAFVVIVYGVVEKHGYDGLALATLIAACILILMGISRCGVFIRFIPFTVVKGFTAGIAVVIFVTQIKDFFGLSIPEPSPEFVQSLTQYWTYKSSCNVFAAGTGIAAILIIVFCRKISPKLPAAIIAVVATSLFAYLFNLPIDTVEKKFGAIPNTLPLPSLPVFSLEKIQAVFSDAITIALLGAIESLLAAVVADGMTGYRHKSNLELIAQGIGNMGSIIFGGIPATGAVARTTANIQLEAKSPISGMVNAITILLMMLLFAPLAGKIPLATLAATLIYIAYHMSEMDHFIEMLKGPKGDALVLLTTFALTIFIDLTVAVQAGVLLAAFIFLKHMTDKTTVQVCSLLQEEENRPQEKEEPLPRLQGIEVFEIDGPLFFAVSDVLNDALRRLPKKPKAFILRMRKTPLVDTSGMQALKQFHTKCKKENIRFLVCEVRTDVMQVMNKISVKKTLGENTFFATLNQALAAV